jgi:hypothetical protein
VSENSNPTPPTNIPSNPPTPHPSIGSSRLIIDAIQPTIKEVRDEIKAVERKVDSHFKWLLATFGGGFVILGSMLIGGFLFLDTKLDSQDSRTVGAINGTYVNLDDKFEKTQEVLIRVTTQLDDLLQRVPAVPQPPSK